MKDFFYCEFNGREFFFKKGKSKDFRVLAKPFSDKKSRNNFWGSFAKNLNFAAEVKKLSVHMPSSTKYGLHEVQEYPQKNDWINNIKNLKTPFSRGLKKIVLARCKEWKIEGAPSSVEIFEKFRSTSFENSYKFALFDKDKLFFGASPELLFHLKGNKIYVPAIAGTRRKNSNYNLFKSKKEMTEHRLVVSDIVDKLKKLGASKISINGPKILSATSVEHLFSEVHAVFPKNKTPEAEVIVNTLHPTPAMCGTPQKLAQKLINKIEAWNRGFYAAPIGFIDAQKKEALFIVGIRSALIDKNRAFLFAGAGILPESNPETEWQETERKMETIFKVFGTYPVCKKTKMPLSHKPGLKPLLHV